MELQKCRMDLTEAAGTLQTMKMGLATAHAESAATQKTLELKVKSQNKDLKAAKVQAKEQIKQIAKDKRIETKLKEEKKALAVQLKDDAKAHVSKLGTATADLVAKTQANDQITSLKMEALQSALALSKITLSQSQAELVAATDNFEKEKVKHEKSKVRRREGGRGGGGGAWFCVGSFGFDRAAAHLIPILLLQ
jgi:hypothetical protein